MSEDVRQCLDAEFEAHLAQTPPDILQLFEEHDLDEDDKAAAIAVYMVFRVNGMQWAAGQVALCRVASKAVHSCNANSAFAHVHGSLHARAVPQGRPAVRATRAVLDTLPSVKTFLYVFPSQARGSG